MAYKYVTFSFDDGVMQDRKLAALFNRLNIHATFNLNTGIQSEESQFDIGSVHVRRMNQEGLESLYRGHEIAVHGRKHLALTELTREQFDEEITGDIQAIRELYGETPMGMAYAYGAYNEKVKGWLRESGLVYARTVEQTERFDLPADYMEWHPTCHYHNERLMDLLMQFEEAEATHPMLFYVWGHSYEFDVYGDFSRFESFCERVARNPEIHIVTNGEFVRRFFT